MAEKVASETALYIVCATVPFLSGLSIGLSGAGSAIILQILYRLAIVFYSGLDEGENEINRRIMAILTICNISSYPPLFWQIYTTGKFEYRKDIVLFTFIGINGLTFLGTFAAKQMDGVILGISIGFLLLVVAIYQFTNQSIRHRRIDDNNVRKNYESSLQGLLDDDKQFTSLDDLKTQDTVVSDVDINFSLNTDSAITTDNAMLKESLLGDSEPDIPLENETVIFSQNSEDVNTNENTENTEEGESNLFLDDLSEKPVKKAEVQYDVADMPWLFSVRFLIYCKQHIGHIFIASLVSSFAGFLGGLCGINGPVMMIYLSFLNLTGGQLRETVLVVFGLNLPLTVVSRLYYNVMRLDEWIIYLIVFPVNYFGLKLGQYLQKFCDTRLVLTLFQILTALASIPLTTTLGKKNHRTLDYVMVGIYIALIIGMITFIIWRISRNRKIKKEVDEKNTIPTIEKVF